MIRNTADMNDPVNSLLPLADAMLLGPSGAIEAQEARGQQELVHSDRLPTDTSGTDEAFLALGFTFDDPDPSDPMFRPATLPDGWTREGSDHAMWSYIVDQLGRRRVGIFYKAAFYDRSAHMSLTSVFGYISEQLYHGRDIATDPEWATPAAIAESCHKKIADIDEYLPYYDGEARQKREQERAKYVALAEKYDA